MCGVICLPSSLCKCRESPLTTPSMREKIHKNKQNKKSEDCRVKCTSDGPPSSPALPDRVCVCVCVSSPHTSHHAVVKRVALHSSSLPSPPLPGVLTNSLSPLVLLRNDGGKGGEGKCLILQRCFSAICETCAVLLFLLFFSVMIHPFAASSLTYVPPPSPSLSRWLCAHCKTKRRSVRWPHHF
jgi:hypothetical protein